MTHVNKTILRNHRKIYAYTEVFKLQRNENPIDPFSPSYSRIHNSQKVTEM